ncbi:hypothetical protein, conserved [Plasmodium gonderi]|uniref:OTU domain-containing protein n=1 Tax=Plasmodium gonderi TaxID=77519 RepID=A0A1Y1JIS8_PLAGO|nr:hypothetical protein, conserved [Plasmodium gonderi]GAW80014.1 hypothetical protein, conserved [Plasmodium gonderi]
MNNQNSRTMQQGNETKEKKSYNKKENEIINHGINYSLTNDHHDNNFKKYFYIRSIRTDGNCLFRAVADQLYNNEDNYKEIRKLVVSYLQRNEEKYKHFIEHDESYKSYIQRISLDGTWGGQLELQAVGELFTVNILIYQENGCILEIKNHSDDKKCIQLHYASSEHYNSVRFKSMDLENELKTIVELREILNNKDDNESTKTFYETTENELTEDNDDDLSDHSSKEKNKVGRWEDEKEHTHNSSTEDDFLLDDYLNSKSRISVFSLSDDENEPSSFDILQNIHNVIKRKRIRSRSMPNINERFLYFFSKKQRNDNMESDSTIDLLNEKKNFGKKKAQKNEKRKLNFFKYKYIGKNLDELLSERLSANSSTATAIATTTATPPCIEGNEIVRIYYNKAFYQYLHCPKILEEEENEQEQHEPNDKEFHFCMPRYIYNNGQYSSDGCKNHNNKINVHGYYKKEMHKNIAPNEGGNQNAVQSDDNALYKSRKYLNTSGRKGYISNYEVENNFKNTRKKKFDDFINLYSEKISYNAHSFCKSAYAHDTEVFYAEGLVGLGSKKKHDQREENCQRDQDKGYGYLNSDYAQSLSINKTISSNEELNAPSLYFDKGSDSLELQPDLQQDFYDKAHDASYVIKLDEDNKFPIHCSNSGEKNFFNSRKKNFDIFNIIIDEEYGITVDSNMLCARIGSKYMSLDSTNQKNKKKNKKENPWEGVLSSFDEKERTYVSNNVTTACRSSQTIAGVRTVSTSLINRQNHEITHMTNCSIRNIPERNYPNGHGISSTVMHVMNGDVLTNGGINSREFFLKKKYQNKKFINMFSKDIQWKGLFQFLNADFLLNEDKIKYIISFLFNNKQMNIFKNNLNRNDFHFYEHIAFSFNLNRQKLRNKIECSKVLNEEFLIKEKHKYRKFIKSPKTKTTIPMNKEQKNPVKIISI